ncbi:hypothetical protein BDV40DRAFT_254232 [Aspergillus tamarii]|uniref:Uncharacterized protein n=1 Tax=Aspergillus tamarii TaxID=41984 RepID=A0A5N6V8D4_ASPTM|nr:hypothetical protein BDV40DRAFT_254232 [Aspergillus tamarii]
MDVFFCFGVFSFASSLWIFLDNILGIATRVFRYRVQVQNLQAPAQLQNSSTEGNSLPG